MLAWISTCGNDRPWDIEAVSNFAQGSDFFIDSDICPNFDLVPSIIVEHIVFLIQAWIFIMFTSIIIIIVIHILVSISGNGYIELLG